MSHKNSCFYESVALMLGEKNTRRRLFVRWVPAEAGREGEAENGTAQESLKEA